MCPRPTSKRVAQEDDGVQVVERCDASLGTEDAADSPQEEEEVEPLAETPPPPRQLSVWDAPGYSITFHTSALPMAGTDSQVVVELIGRSSTSGPLLVSSQGRRKLPFKVGHGTTAILRDLPSVGDLVEIRVSTDGKGLFPAWHLSSVDVEHLASGMVFVFPCGRWLDRWCSYERVLWADSGRAERLMRRRSLRKARNPLF